MVSKGQVIEALEKLVPREKISGVVINGAHIGFAILANDEVLRKSCEKAVFGLPGVEKVTAVLTGEKGEIKVDNKNAEMLDRRQALPGVNKIIMIASGKGGVGKSTMAVNLAVAAAAQGLRIGLVDADIYGPSVPRMLGIQASDVRLQTLDVSNLKSKVQSLKPEIVDGKMIPFTAHGVLCNSIGFLIEENDAAIWRGPMALKALHQLMLGTKWDVAGGLDCLFIDMPPGTGDIQLTLAQNYKIDGAVLVSTPQEVAVADVRRAFRMFVRTKIPVIGLVQNMSYLATAKNDEPTLRQYIFGKDGAKRFAEENNIPFIGDVPLRINLRENSDNGSPNPPPEFLRFVDYIVKKFG